MPRYHPAPSPREAREADGDHSYDGTRTAAGGRLPRGFARDVQSTTSYYEPQQPEPNPDPGPESEPEPNYVDPRGDDRDVSRVNGLLDIWDARGDPGWEEEAFMRCDLSRCGRCGRFYAPLRTVGHKCRRYY